MIHLRNRHLSAASYELLPWADPYIAQLMQKLRSEKTSCRIKSYRGAYSRTDARRRLCAEASHRFAAPSPISIPRDV